VKTVANKQVVNGLEKINIEYQNFDTKELGVLFYGENLDEAKLSEMLKSLVKPLKEKVKLRNRDSLTPEEIKKLEIDNRGYGLENGEFFDGSRFKDVEGNFLEHHPKLDELLN